MKQYHDLLKSILRFAYRSRQNKYVSALLWRKLANNEHRKPTTARCTASCQTARDELVNNLFRKILAERLKTGSSVELGPIKLGELKAELNSVREELELLNDPINSVVHREWVNNDRVDVSVPNVAPRVVGIINDSYLTIFDKLIQSITQVVDVLPVTNEEDLQLRSGCSVIFCAHRINPYVGQD